MGNEHFKFNCLAKDIIHDCTFRNSAEPEHPQELIRCVDELAAESAGLKFEGTIRSKSNACQIDYDFDDRWITRMESFGWTNVTSNFGKTPGRPNVRPDAVLKRAGTTIAFEIEKSNEKKIPFDFMKVLNFIKHKEVDFGLIVAPYNYAHNSGVWNVFECARQYRWWLAELATPALMSKVAVIGYKQYAEFSGQWRLLDSAEVKRIKEKARGKFQ